jgi:hypothetical protein
MNIRFTRITSLASVIFPSFKQIANRLSRVDRICDTNGDVVFDGLFVWDDDVLLSRYFIKCIWLDK